MEANDEPQLQGGGRQNLDAEDAWIQLLSPFRRIVEDAVANTSFTLDISHNYPDRMNKANWTASFKSGEQQRAARPPPLPPKPKPPLPPKPPPQLETGGKRKRLRGRGAGGAGGRRSPPPLPPKPKPPPQLETGGKRKRLRGRGLGSAGGP